MLPTLLVITSYGGPFPATFETVRTLAVIAAGVVAGLVALRPLGGSLEARAATLSASVIVFSSYRTVLEAIAPANASRIIEQPWVAGAFTLAALLVGVAVRRPWDPSGRRTPLLSVLALGMLALGAVPPAWLALRAPRQAWGPEADNLIASALTSVRKTTPERDVYVIVLDGLGRSDVLRALYGVDDAPLASFLKAQGFHVPDRAQAPYSQTELTLSALLNMGYLDQVATVAGRASRDRSPTEYLLARNAMMAAARHAGYDVVSVGSEFGPTQSFRDARVVAKLSAWPSELEQETMKMTPFAALPVSRWTSGAHRVNVLTQLAALESLKPSPGSPHRLVFAHVLAPHPPFVFEADGRARALDTNWLSMGDGNHYDGSEESYLRGYSAQTRFVLARLEEVMRAILSHPGPTPAILITSDHGPGSKLRWEDPHSSNLIERMSVFAAYRFPGVDDKEFSATLSPVSAARILANTYFGTNLPPLPTRSAFSTWQRPYDFLQLLPDAAAN